jgi:opacity protein-like surface antigen
LFAADAVYLSVGGEKAIAIRGDTGSLSLTQHETILQPMAGYAIRRSTFSVDLLAGLRYWNLSTKLDVERPRASNERSASRQWVDALGGVRLRGVAPGHLRYLVGGDGGGGGSRGTWQAYGVGGYDVSSLITVDLGYRYLDVDYDHDLFLFDTRTHGVIVGVTFRF